MNCLRVGRKLGAATVVMSTVVVLGAHPAFAARKAQADTTRPSVTISSPTAGATVAGTVNMSGTASDNAAVAKVDVAVDGGAWQTASGTTSWATSFSSTVYSNGSHTLAARATDTSGNTTTKTETLTLSNPVPDTTPPSVAISSPAPATTVAGTATVSGTAGDNTAVATVEIAVDGGAWQQASGTTSWSWNLSSTTYANGTHTLSARATDTSGNTTTASESLTVSNPVPDTTAPSVAISSPAPGSTVAGAVSVSGTAGDNVAVSTVEVAVDGGTWQTASGTTSWSANLNTAAYSNGAHTIAARSTDSSGNVSPTSSESVTVSNAATPAPNTQGTWTSPEGATISVNSAGPWTIAQIYQMLKDNSAAAGDFAQIAPTLTVKVQDAYASQTTTSVSQVGTTFSNYHATVWLRGVSSTFADTPDNVLAHEYGHAWAHYYLYMTHQGDWSSWLGTRWDTADGSVVLAQDSRMDSSMTWSKSEMIADDYRLLFGSSAAISENDCYGNPNVPDPRSQAGLRACFLSTWM